MAWIEETLKKVGTIQPGQCGCLPQMTKHMLADSIEERIRTLQDEFERAEKAQRETPIFAERITKIVEEDQDYQKGLKTAREISTIWAKQIFDELRDMILANNYLLQMVRGIPSCNQEADHGQNYSKAKKDGP